MKKNEKKMKAKHFRYLSKENIEKPMSYINNFYGIETSLPLWLDDLNTLVNASFCTKMKSTHSQSNGYNCKRLIEQVEFAHSLFVHYNLKRKKGKLNLQPINFHPLTSTNPHNKLAKKELISETLCLFFSFQSLKQWYKTLDRLWVNLIDIGDTIQEYESIGEEHLVIIKELFTRLAITLHLIYEIGEVPEYGTYNQSKEHVISKENNQTTNKINLNKIADSCSNTEASSPKINIDKNSNTLKTIKNKIKYPFGIESLCDLQNLCLELHQYIEINRKDWNELFQFTEPEIFLSSYSVIKEILDVIAQNINDIYSMRTDSHRLDIDNYYKNWIQGEKIQFLSISELASPEHYLYLIYTSYDAFDWTINLDELFRVFLTLNKDEVIYDVKLPAHFLLDLKKIIELSYIIAFKDEIELVSSPALERLEN